MVPFSGRDLHAAALLLAYYIAFAGAIGVATRLVELPREWIRKSYHVFCSLSVFILLLYFEHWYAAVLALSLLMLAGYVLLLIGDRIPLASTAIDRGRGLGEIREHLLLLLAAMVTLLTLFWGIAGGEYRYAIAVGLLVWGFGDSAAALVGARYARRQFRVYRLDPHKSPLGTAAMIVVSAAVTVPVLLWLTPLAAPLVPLAATFVGVVAGSVEAVTRNGLDTLSVPVSASVSAWCAVTGLGLQGLPIPQ